MSVRRRFVSALLAALTALAMTAVAVSSAPAASAEANGVGLKPALGWSSWSFLRHDPTTAKVEAQARAMVTSGLSKRGYQYVNLDDFWYQCPGSQGPNVDAYGRWVIDATKFPSQRSTNGIQALADYVHHLGLKFGIYVTPGISKQAVAQNTAIKGTPYHARDIATMINENNYNCGGMVGIDYSKPGAQAFINSWADQFASWGVDYVKMDGVGSFDIPDVQAWSHALVQTGRPIHLELSNSLNIADASVWKQYSNGWRTGGDIECYCSSTSYPLTDWSQVASRFDQVAAWAPYGGPGAYNDYDSIEVGNGSNDGLTPDERKTQMSLWALAASPLILGIDLTHLDPTDLGYLKNRAVISVDQDGVDAHRIVDTSTRQVFTKTERNGYAVVGLFNTGSQSEIVSTSAKAVGLVARPGYLLNDVWTHRSTETAGTISADVPPHGVALVRVGPAHSPRQAPPSTTLSLTGASAVRGDHPVTETVAFTDNGRLPAQRVRLSLQVPAGWSVTPPAKIAAVVSGRTVSVTFRVTAPPPTQPFGSGTVTARASYMWPGGTPQRSSVDKAVTTIGPAVKAPYLTYSSASDAAAHFSQAGQRFGIEGAGADLYVGADDYSAIYQRGAVGATSTVETEVSAQQGMTGFAKAGIMVRNNITGAGTTPEGVVLFESPSGGLQLEWDSNGGLYVDSVTPPNGTIADTLPVYLKLVRNGATYTGSYSTNGRTWQPVGTATVPDQAATQDAGMFMLSHTAGSPGSVTFGDFSVS